MYTEYHIVKNFNQLKKLVSCCKKTGYASVDFETNGKPLYVGDFKPTILSVTFQVGSSYCIPLQHHDDSLQFLQEGDLWLKWLRYFGRKVIENDKIVKVAQNWKFDNQIFHKYGIYHRGTVIDTMLAKHLLDEERPHDLKSMVSKYLPEFGGYEKEKDFDKIPWDRKPLDRLCEYGGRDTDFTFRLGMFLESKLMSLGFYPIYRNLVMAASRVLQSAEEHGLPFDIKLNHELNERYKNKIEDITNRLRESKVVKRFERELIKSRKEKLLEEIKEELEAYMGVEGKERMVKSREEKMSRIISGDYQTKAELAITEPVNFASQKQMVELLFLSEKGFKFPIIEYTVDKHKRPTNNPSTSEAVLVKLKSKDKTGFIDNLLDLRGIQTIYSTFIVGLGEIVQDDKRIHPTYFLHGTTSGRLSSRNPNGQNIPKTQVNPDIKPQFITPKGKLFLAYDYSQAELRILAHLAKEKTMLEWFRTGKDIHLASACKKYHEDYDKILPIYRDEQHPEYKLWKKRRKQAKTINFGIVYEQTAKKLAETLSEPEKGEIVQEEEAQIFLDEFFENFPRIRKFIDNQHKFMEENGYAVSLFGRKRRCPKVWSDNYGEYLEALRQSTNMPCQSAASDMALFASVIVYEKVKRGELPPMVEVNTVHDSVYQFIEPKYLTPDVIYSIWDICRNPKTKQYFGFEIKDVDMSMDFTIGRTMAEELPYIPGYDYTKLLEPDFSIDEYYQEEKKTKGIDIADYPKKFKSYFKDGKHTINKG